MKRHESLAKVPDPELKVNVFQDSQKIINNNNDNSNNNIIIINNNNNKNNNSSNKANKL
jgi:hypothetical protein